MGSLMEYFEEVINRSTGELTKVSHGDWITITELGDLHGAGPREARTILRKMEVLHVEGAARHQRHRLASWVTQKGWGKRIERRGSIPFDVVGPDLRKWVAARWEQTIAELTKETTGAAAAAREALRKFNSTRSNGDLSTQQAVTWLICHFPDLTQSDMASILGVTQQLVSKFKAIRDRQLQDARALKAMDPDERHALWLSEGGVCGRGRGIEGGDLV